MLVPKVTLLFVSKNNGTSYEYDANTYVKCTRPQDARLEDFMNPAKPHTVNVSQQEAEPAWTLYI